MSKLNKKKKKKYKNLMTVMVLTKILPDLEGLMIRIEQGQNKFLI
jgi:hypothetical protein